jgi:hypothetical protein
MKIIHQRHVKNNSCCTCDKKITSSPGDKYSPETVRLIKERPVWQPAMGNSKIVADSFRVSIIFK